MPSTRIGNLAILLIITACACGNDADNAASDTDGGAAVHTGTGGAPLAGSGGHIANADAGMQQRGPTRDAGTTGGGSGGHSNTDGMNDAGSAHDAGGTSTAGDAGSAATPCPDAKPDATNTGVPAGVKLTLIDHDVTISDDDALLDAQDIHGFLVIDADRVHVTRSIIRGREASANGAGIVVRSGTEIVIEDSEVALSHPSAWLDGVSGDHFTIRRSNIHGGVDGMKVGSNSNVECNFIHDMQSFESDPNQNGGPTHNDAIQILSGQTIRITGNQLLAAKDQNSAIQVTQDFGAVGDLVIEANWADGGGCTFNFSHNGGDSLAVTTRNNRFGRDSFYDCPILESTKTELSSSGDVWDDDSTQVPVQTHD